MPLCYNIDDICRGVYQCDIYTYEACLLFLLQGPTTVSSQLEYLVGHKGQIMNCSLSKSQNDRIKKIISM